jgi:6-phosphogluconolactonase
MRKTTTTYGTLCVGPKQAIFDEAVALAAQHQRCNELKEMTFALTGGSTPAEFYRHCVDRRTLPPELVAKTCWFTSDERMVPLDSDESNFGNAGRLLLDPLGIPAEKRFPWPVAHEPGDAAHLFNALWHTRFSDFRCFDVCFLGMGDDCHTASIFPHSPLVAHHGTTFFTSVEVPDKGPRLTITRFGLSKCGLIVVMATGKKKAMPLSMVFNDLYDPELRPIQLLRDHADRTVWLVDEDAASLISGS